eukprot:TRINITY_DN1759_c0_g2_i9.p1 TRINITY_DN1759_c0_g2~~TRINITY_DN1759_c0_g2_i9.p1  ORF type:complete len:855 (+),score=332.33 TRINITY_DN1759_c0_g2_i9:99-2663(+)
MRKINVNRITKAGGIFTFWVADWFAKLNHKMGGDLEKIQVLGKYFIEVWRASGMDLKNVRFLWASDIIQQRAERYWPRVLDIATKNTLARIVKCSQIMGRKEQDTLSASQIVYPCMQCSDIIELQADMCQLGMDQRKVNVLALEYFDAIGKTPKPVIVSHHILLGLQQDPTSDEPTKMSKSNPDAAIFMEDEAEDVARKIKKAYCPEKIVKLNPILEYVKYIIFGTFDEMVVERKEANGGNKTYTKYEDLEADYVSGALHPGDLKPAVIKYINDILKPVREHFKNDEYAKGLLQKVIKFREEEKEKKEKEQKKKGPKKEEGKKQQKAKEAEKVEEEKKVEPKKDETKVETGEKKERKVEITVPVPELAVPPKSFGGRTRIRFLMERHEEFVDKVIYVAGWCRTLRFTKNVAFAELSDGSGPQSIQVVVDTTIPNYVEFEKLRAGSSVGFKGKIVKSIGSKQLIEMQVKNEPEHLVKIYGDCPADQYPLAKKEHSNEFLREIAHLRPRTHLIGAVTRIRNALIMATHMFFQGKGMLYIHTPIITASDCEGAGEMFQVTTLLSQAKNKPDKIPTSPESKEVNYQEDFFKKEAFLSVSGQLEVETFACSMCDVYTFGPTFRAEKSNTQRHLAEFWMIEPELAFADVHDLSDMAEEYLKYCVAYVMKNNADDLKYFDEKAEKGLIDRLRNILDNTFARLTYTQAVELLMQHVKEGKAKFENEVSWGIDLFFEHEKYLTGQVFKKPLILRDYPKDIKAFYMKVNEDNKTVRGIDVLVPKIGEIIGGSQREERLDVLDRRIGEMKLDKENYSWYRDLRRYGSVPHSGFGVGFERLIMLVTGVDNIRDVIPFPRSLGHAEF